jgi:hypothetical protein
MPRESREAKALRLLTSARLSVEVVDQNTKTVRARCRGDSAEVYLLGYRRGEGWYCECACLTMPCSHVVALWHVVVRPGALP